MSKTTPLITLAVVFVLLTGAGSAQAQQLLFSDNFYHGSGYSYDINLNYASSSRQSGSVGRLTYQERGETRPGQPADGATILSHPWEDPATLNLFTNALWGDPFAYPWVSPNHNFTEGGRLRVEFDVDPLGPNSVPAAHFAGIVIGTSVQGAYIVPGSGQFGTATSQGVGITLTDDGVWAVYEDNNPIPLATGAVANAHSGYYHVAIGLDTPAFDGSPARVSLSIDGQQIHSHIRANGFTSNFVTLAGGGAGSPYQVHIFDNLRVTRNGVVAAPGSIGRAKLLPDGTVVLLVDEVLYAKQAGSAYIEEQDRSAGIRLEGTIAASEDQLVSVSGALGTGPGGERCIQVDTVTAGDYAEVKPLGASNSGLRSGLMDGLYVTAWGRVVPGSVSSNSFVISDGTDSSGIKVVTEDAPNVSEGDYATVSGAAGSDGSRVIHTKSRLPYQVSTKNVELMERSLADFFPFGVYYHNVFSNTPVESQSAANSLLADFKAHNINCILGGGCWPQHREYFINAAQNSGLKLVMALGVGGYDESIEGDMPAHDRLHEIFRQQVKSMGSLLDSPAIVGGYADEPPIGKEQKYRNITSTLYEEDPVHPCFVCLVGNTISPYYAAIWPKDVLFYDAYFIQGSNGVGDFHSAMYGGQDLTQHIDQVRGYIHPMDDTPMWIILQAHNDLSYNQNGQLYEALRVPQPVELRLQTWLALAHGAKGISWFMYPVYPQGAGLPDRLVLQNTPANYAEVSAIGAKVAALAPTLTKLRMTQNIASIGGGGSPYYPTGDVQTLIDDSPYRTPLLTGQDGAFTLSGDARVTADVDASDKSSARIINSSTANSVRWSWPSEGFKPGVEYDLYVSAKVRHTIDGYNLPTGSAFTLGVRNEQGADVVAPITVPGEISKPMVYRPYKIGTFIPANAKYVYVSGVGNQANFPDVYVDRFYFVEKGDKYLIVANRNCQNSSNVMLSFPLSAADKYGKGLIDVVNVYSGATLWKSINNGTVSTSVNLGPGDGAVLQLRSRE